MAGKGDEFLPHPVKDQLPGVDFCLASHPPWPEAIILGFQHYLVMLGTTILIPTILVPQMGGTNVDKANVIQTLLFVSGINTLLQTTVGSTLPVVIGGSYTFIIPSILIIFSKRFSLIADPYERFIETMRAIQGAIMFASILPILAGFLGLWRILLRFLSPLAAVPLVTLVGLGLFALGFPQLAKCVELGLPALILLILLSQYLSHVAESRKSLGGRYGVVVTIAIVWAFAEILTAGGAYKHSSPETQFSCRTDRSGVLEAAPWIRFPYPFQWGRPTLNIGDGFAMMAAALVAMIESTGTCIAASRYASATPLPPSIASRGISWLGIGILLDGLFGTLSGSTASVENAGLLGLNRVGSRRVVQVAAGFMLFFSVLGKFGAVLASIPLPIFAAMYCVLFAYVASAGIGFLQFCNLNSFRTKFIVGFSIFMGLSIPQYFNEFLLVAGYGPVHTHSYAFNSIVQVIFSSPATVAAILAILLDTTLERYHPATRCDSGRHWWVKFRSYSTDTRSEEFYELPYGLNNCRSSPAVVRFKQPPPSATSLSPLPRPPPEPPSISQSPNSTVPSPSLSCALQCLHFQSCSGCTHEYNLDRPSIVDEAVAYFKRYGVPDFTFDTCRLWGWRCRAKLAVRGSSENPLIGLYQEGTHDVVDIPHCKAHHPSINAAVELLRKGIIKLNVEPYDEDLGTGELRYVQMAVTTYNTSLPLSERYKHGKVQVTLVWNSRSENSPSFQKLDALANFIWRTGGPRCSLHLIHSVWANFQTSSNNVIFGNRWRHILGERDFWEHIGEIDVSLAPSSFGQANTRAFDSLLHKLHKYVPIGSSVADLYGGSGVIGLSLAATRKCRSVKCIEINKEAKLSFEKTISRLPAYIDSNISWHHADAAIDPLSWLVGSDVLVVDPPRKGLDPSVVAALQSISAAEKKLKTGHNSDLKPKDEKRPWILREKEASVTVQSKSTFSEGNTLPHTIIYISCGWSSFKEDCKSLLSHKVWLLDKAHGFNFFPGTDSIEVLAVFKRGTTEKKKKSSKKKKKKKTLS